MALKRMDHVGIVVDDLADAIEFFTEVGLALDGEWSAEDPRVDRIIGLEGVKADVAMMKTPDGGGQIELSKFRSPAHQGDDRQAPANAPGIRHLSFEIEDLDAVLDGLQARGAELVGEVLRYGDTYRLCYVRGPAGIIVELAERAG